MIKIFDCSNSNQISHKRKFGPKDNDIIYGLKYYSSLFDCKFVNDYKNADVIITNDIYPDYIKNLDIPKIKRMDGIYWNNENKEKNLELNESASISDHVIFISNYSKNALNTLYPEIKIKNYSIILNVADDKIFKNFQKKDEYLRSFSASCTDWSRSEKRFKDLINFSENISEKIYLIGHCDNTVPNNIIKMGYINNYFEINKILNKTSAFINLSYRDAAPKVVCQAVSCGLPVLYADSGGTGELIDYGIPINDEKNIFFSNELNELNIKDILESYYKMKKKFNSLFGNKKRNYLDMISNYFKIIKQYGN